MMLVHGLGIGGAEAMLCHVARYLRRRGTDVEIGCLGELGHLGEALRADGARVVMHLRKPGFDRTLPLRLARRLRQGRFDVVHAHQRTALDYSLLAGLLDPTPLVYTEHGPLFPRPSIRKRRAFNRLLGWRLHRITAVSESLKRELAEIEGFALKKIDIIPNAVDPSRFEAATLLSRAAARGRLGLPPNAPVLGTVGRLAPVKNHRLLIHVVERLRQGFQGFNDLHLVLVGEGEERRDLEALVRELHLEDCVHFLGVCRDVAQILPAFDVFCLSSLAEGIPLTLLEAMAARVPTVSTAVGGVPEAIRCEQEGLLVEGIPPDCRNPLTDSGVRYVESFAEAAERLLVNEGLRRRLSDRAFERARECFSVDAVCRRYEDVLVSATQRRV